MTTGSAVAGVALRVGTGVTTTVGSRAGATGAAAEGDAARAQALPTLAARPVAAHRLTGATVVVIGLPVDTGTTAALLT